MHFRADLIQPGWKNSKLFVFEIAGKSKLPYNNFNRDI